MKKTMKRLFGILLLAMVGIVARAEGETAVTVQFGTFTGGTVIEKDNSQKAVEGGISVTIVVTPAEGYFIEKKDVVVMPTYGGAVRKKTDEPSTPSIAGALELTGDEPADLTLAREYTFVVPAGLGAGVTEANFHQIATSGKFGEKETLTWDVQKTTVEGGEDVVTLTIGGDGDVPVNDAWAMLKSKITNVVLGEGITAIGANLFSDFTGLKAIVIQNDKAVIGLGNSAIPANVTIDVPGNLYNEYLVTDGWKLLTIGSASAVQMKGLEFTDANSYDTFVSSQTVKVPSVLNAYIIVGIKDNTLVLEEIKDGIIPADVPVLLLSKELKSNVFLTASVTSETKGGAATNLLKVAPEGGMQVTLGEVYLLYKDVFYLSQAGTIPAGAVYLIIPKEETPTKARSYALAAGGTTGITTVSSSAVASPVWYSLDGRGHEGKPTRKGIYIIRGKKVVIK